MKRKLLTILALCVLATNTLAFSFAASSAAAAAASASANNTLRMIQMNNQRRSESMKDETMVSVPLNNTSKYYIETSKNDYYVENGDGNVIGTIDNPYAFRSTFGVSTVIFGIVEDDICYLEVRNTTTMPERISIEGSDVNYKIGPYFGTKYRIGPYSEIRYLFRVVPEDLRMIRGRNISIVINNDKAIELERR